MCTTIFILLSCLSSFAQEIPQKVTIASSPNPVGSGARAMGMGGAFIAVADDATAASWNPAGLTQLRKPEFSFALSYFRRREDYSSERHPEAEGMQRTLSKDLNYFSIAYPFKLLNRNMIVSLNYQRLFEFYRNIKTDFVSYSNNPAVRFEQKMDFRQQGKLSTISPAYAIQVTPYFSLGFTFNIWTDNLFWSNGWESDTIITGAIARPGRAATTFRSKDRDRYYGFSGFNMHIGFLWDINRYITIGGVVKTPFTGELQHERSVTTRIKSPNGGYTTTMRIDEDVDLEMPLSYGLGLAVRFTDTFTVSLDVFRTEWSHFILEDGQGRRMSALTGKPSQEAHIRPTHQVRLGAEYLIILQKTIIPLRFGLFYDPEPSEKHPEDFWGFSVGTGISIGNIVLDFAYQFRFGDEVEGEVLDIPSTHADVTQHLLMASVIYHF